MFSLECLGHRSLRSLLLATFSVSLALPSMAAAQQAQTDSPSRTSTSAASQQPSNLKFTFRHAPWEEVLEWLAEESGLSFSTEVIPTGTFNYVDPSQSFTVGEAIDLVNSYLLIKGYTLVRKGRMLIVIDLEDELDAQLVRDLLTETPVDQLDQRGDYEITKTRFNLDKADAEAAEQQIKELLSPVGSIVVMPGAKQILATETGGTLRMIRDVIDSLEKTAAENEKGKLHAFHLQVASADEVLIVARPLLGIEEEEFADEDATIRISADALGRTVFATGEAEKIQLVKQIVEQVDSQNSPAQGDAVLEAQQFMSHKVANADPDAVLRVLQTLFVGDAMLRLDVDRSTGSIIAYAKPSQHRAIKATIAEMEQNPERLVVIPLRSTDPEAASMLIEKLFSTSQKPPIVDGTIIPPQLIVRGTQPQIEQIRSLLADMGEDGDAQSAVLSGRFSRTPRSGNIRLIQMSPEAAVAALEQIQRIWPGIRNNEIRVVTPAQQEQDSLRSGPLGRPNRGRTGRRPQRLDATPQPAAPERDDSADDRSDDEAASADRPISNETKRRHDQDEVVLGLPASGGFQTQLVVDTSAANTDLANTDLAKTPAYESAGVARIAAVAQEASAAEDNSNAPPNGPDAANPPADQDSSDPAAAELAPADDSPEIVVAPTNDGLMISSKDEDALNAIQTLIEALTSSGAAQGPRFNLFYLKHVEAETARTLLESILSGLTTASSTVSTSTSDERTGLVGNLQQGATLTLGIPHMVADKRLNALFVQGEPSQIAMIRQLLDVIDIESGPEEVLTFPRPRFIPVYNTDAENVAQVIREVYANRIETGEANRRGNGDDPSRGGGRFGGFGFFGRGGGRDRGDEGDRRGGGQQAAGDLPKMTVGVDTETNALVVSAPGPLLTEVESVVRELDRRAAQKPPETVRVYNLKRTDALTVRDTLANILGEMVETSTTNNRQSNGRRPGVAPRNEDNRGADFAEQFRQGGFSFPQGGNFGDRGGGNRAFRGGADRGGADGGSRGRGGGRGGGGGGDRGR